MSGANENTPLVVGGGANDSLEQYLLRIQNCRTSLRESLGANRAPKKPYLTSIRRPP